MMQDQFWRRPATRFYGLGAKYIFRQQDFCFYYMFKTNSSGQNKIWGGIGQFGGTAHEWPRGYRPACSDVRETSLWVFTTNTFSVVSESQIVPFKANKSTGVFRKSSQSLVRPWALILGGRIYGANIWVEYRYYLYLSRYTVRPTLYWVWILFVVVILHQRSANVFIAAQITFSIAIEGPLHLKPLEQNEWTKRIRHRQYATAV